MADIYFWLPCAVSSLSQDLAHTHTHTYIHHHHIPDSRRQMWRHQRSSYCFLVWPKRLKRAPSMNDKLALESGWKCWSFSPGTSLLSSLPASSFGFHSIMAGSFKVSTPTLHHAPLAWSIKGHFLPRAGEDVVCLQVGRRKFVQVISCHPFTHELHCSAVVSSSMLVMSACCRTLTFVHLISH